MDIEINNIDNQSVISDITDLGTTFSGDMSQKFEEIRAKTETDLNRMTTEMLKFICKSIDVKFVSKIKKNELVQLLMEDCVKHWNDIKLKTVPELHLWTFKTPTLF